MVHLELVHVLQDGHGLISSHWSDVIERALVERDQKLRSVPGSLSSASILLAFGLMLSPPLESSIGTPFIFFNDINVFVPLSSLLLRYKAVLSCASKRKRGRGGIQNKKNKLASRRREPTPPEPIVTPPSGSSRPKAFRDSPSCFSRSEWVHSRHHKGRSRLPSNLHQ